MFHRVNRRVSGLEVLERLRNLGHSVNRRVGGLEDPDAACRLG